MYRINHIKLILKFQQTACIDSSFWSFRFVVLTLLSYFSSNLDLSCAWSGLILWGV